MSSKHGHIHLASGQPPTLRSAREGRAILNNLKRWVRGLAGEPAPTSGTPRTIAPDAGPPVADRGADGQGPSTEVVLSQPDADVAASAPALEIFRAQWSPQPDAPVASEDGMESPGAAGAPAGSAPEPHPAVDGPVAGTDETFEIAEAGIADPFAVSLATMLLAAGPSVRLGNVIRRNAVFERHSVRDFLEGSLTPGEVLALPNCGRTTLVEIRSLVKSFASAAAAEFPVPQTAAALRDARLDGLTLGALLEHEGLPVRIANRLPHMPALRNFALSEILNDPAGSKRRLRAIGAIGVRSVDELFACVARVAEDYRPVRPAAVDAERTPDVPPAPPAPLATVRDALASLSEKHRFVLTARYGLGGSKAMTLEQVAQRVFVTRERVRQVQKSAIKALRRRPWFGTFEASLEREGAEAWALLARGRDFVPAGDLSGRTSPLSPHFALAVDVVHGDLPKWIAAFAVSTEGGWLAPGTSAELRQETVRRARDAIAEQPLPYPAADLARAAGLSERELVQAVEATPVVRIHEGYVHRGYFGSKTRRAARLHRLALTEDASVVDVWRLHGIDTDAAHTDERSARMVLMQLGENPQLFAPLFDHLWIVLSPVLRLETGTGTVQHPALNSIEPGFDQGSLSRWLWSRVSEVGPVRLSDLRDDALKAFPTASGSSVAAILQMHPVFYRVGPGVFDVRQERAPGVSPALLSDFQGRAYARALRGGASRLYFSGWTDEFEWRLCEWARWNGDQDVFRSLLDVCDPSTWPAPEATRSEWRKLRKLHRRWSLTTERRAPLGASPPDGSEFFAGLAHLAIFGSIGWIGADRIMQNRLGSQGAADLLAVLTACGAADAPDDWQLPHRATPEAAVLLKPLAQTLRTTGSLTWTDAPLTAVLERSAAGVARVPWARAGEVIGLLHVLAEGKAKPPAREAGTLAEADDLFESDEWNSLFQD